MNAFIFLMYLLFNNSSLSIIYAMPFTYPQPPTWNTTPMTPPIIPTFTVNPPAPPTKKSYSSNNAYWIGGSIGGAIVFFVALFVAQACFKSIKKNKNYENIG